MAIAKSEIDPKDIAPVANLDIFFDDSTLDSGIESLMKLKSKSQIDVLFR